MAQVLVKENRPRFSFPTVESKSPTSDKAKKRCRALGKELVKKLK